jgi:hypothetical protein
MIKGEMRDQMVILKTRQFSQARKIGSVSGTVQRRILVCVRSIGGWGGLLRT